MWKEMLNGLTAIIIVYVVGAALITTYTNNQKINLLEKRVKELEYISFNK